MAVSSKSSRKKKQKKNVPFGVVHIYASFNNTIVSVADKSGNVLASSSAGANGFKGSRKSTPFAAQIAAQKASEEAIQTGVRSVEVNINGPGGGRESALRAIQASGLAITSIRDVTPMPHNGCRPKKRRRV